MYAASLATAEPLTTTPLTRRPQGDFSAACTQRLPGTTADGLVVPTSRGPRDYANLDHAASRHARMSCRESDDACATSSSAGARCAAGAA